MSKEQDLERVTKAIETLGEHFDTVQIFCTRQEGGTSDGTIHVEKGAGNWFARYGQVKNWIAYEEEGARVEYRNDNQ